MINTPCALVQLLATFPVTAGLIMATLAISLNSLRYPKRFAALYLHPYSIYYKKEYYRIICADFVHNDWVHLLLNMVTLYTFGSDLEEYLRSRSAWGSWQFLAIFLISQLTANITTAILNRNNFDYSSAGSSGSIMGCLFAYMLIDPNGTAFDFYLIGGVKNMYLGLAYILLLVVYRWKNKNELVNHEIHFFGAIGGILAALLIFH